MSAKKSQEWAHVTEALKDKTAPAPVPEADVASNDSFRTADGAASVSSFASANSRLSVRTAASSYKSCYDSPARGRLTPTGSGDQCSPRAAAGLPEIRTAAGGAGAAGALRPGADSPPPPFMDYEGDDEEDKGGFSCISLLISPYYFCQNVWQDITTSKAKTQ